MTRETKDHETWAQVTNTSDELMARRGSSASSSVSEVAWSDQGVEYTLRRVATSARSTKPHGHMMNIYSLTSFNTNGPPNGKMVTYVAPDSYVGAAAGEIALGLDEVEPPEVWALGALTLAMHQLER